MATACTFCAGQPPPSFHSSLMTGADFRLQRAHLSPSWAWDSSRSRPGSRVSTHEPGAHQGPRQHPGLRASARLSAASQREITQQGRGFSTRRWGGQLAFSHPSGCPGSCRFAVGWFLRPLGPDPGCSRELVSRWQSCSRAAAALSRPAGPSPSLPTAGLPRGFQSPDRNGGLTKSELVTGSDLPSSDTICLKF